MIVLFYIFQITEILANHNLSKITFKNLICEVNVWVRDGLGCNKNSESPPYFADNFPCCHRYFRKFSLNSNLIVISIHIQIRKLTSENK